MSDSVSPHRRQPTRLPRPWDSPGKNTGVGCHFLLQYMKVKSESVVARSCPTLRDPMDCSPPGSSIHGIFQARVLEWGAIAFSVAYCSVTLFRSYTLSLSHTHPIYWSVCVCIWLLRQENRRYERDLPCFNTISMCFHFFPIMNVCHKR